MGPIATKFGRRLKFDVWSCTIQKDLNTNCVFLKLASNFLYVVHLVNAFFPCFNEIWEEEEFFAEGVARKYLKFVKLKFFLQFNKK